MDIASALPLLDKLRVEHRRLLMVCDALEAFVAGPWPGTVDRLVAVRWDFTREMLLHFAHVETGLLQPMMADQRGEAAARAARSSHDLCGAYDCFSRHAQRWHGLPSEDSWHEYRQAIALLTRRIRVRLVAEESEIHPLLPVRPGGRRVLPATEPINYAAEAWRIRGLLYPTEQSFGATG